MRTDKQIAEYMAYYKDKPKDERKWALENLAKLEKKSSAEIREICERAAKPKQKEEKKPKNEGGRPMIPRDEIRAELLAGGTLCSVAEKLGISSTTVGRIRLEMVKEGLLKAGRPYPGRKKDKQPEAYPGQINDEPEIEDDVKAYVPGEIKTEPKEPTASECKKPEIEDDVKAYIPHETEIAGDCKPEPKPKKSLGESLSDLGAAFCNIFGVGPTKIEIEPDTESVDFVSVLIGLMTFAREQFGEDITLDKISCGKQEEKAEIGFYKGGQLYYLGFYAIAEGEEE